MACAPPIWKTLLDAQQRRRAEDLRARLGARRRRCSARPPPAPGSPSSAAWRAADSGPRECRPPRYRAAARSGPAAGPVANSRHPLRAAAGVRRRRGCWPRRSRPRAANSGARLPRAARSSARARARLARSRPSNLRAYSSSAASPRLRTASRIGAHHRFGFRQAAPPCAPAGGRRLCLSSMRITARSCSADIRRCPARPPASAAG